MPHFYTEEQLVEQPAPNARPAAAAFAVRSTWRTSNMPDAVHFHSRDYWFKVVAFSLKWPDLRIWSLSKGCVKR
jgi:hypothetical protein